MHNWISNDTLKCLSVECAFPLKTVLQDSLYYPACGKDGSPVRHANALKVNSFVYADTFTTHDDLDRALATESFRGYRIVGQRDLTPDDLLPHGWELRLPKGCNETVHKAYADAMRRADASPSTAFGCWIVFERDPTLSDQHGPASLSLLYIRGEGAATYQALYVEQKILPKILAIIRPGTGLGGNFAMFEEFLRDVVRMHPLGMPPQMLQWHPTNEQNQMPDPVWFKFYPKKLLGPLDKDHEPEFSLSLFELQVISFTPFVSLKSISAFEIRGPLVHDWECRYTDNGAPHAQGSGLQLINFTVRGKEDLTESLTAAGSNLGQLWQQVFVEHRLIYILKSQTYPILYVGITNKGLQKGVFGASGRLAHHIRKVFAILGTGTNHTSGWRAHAIARYRDLIAQHENPLDHDSVLTHFADDLEISFGVFSSNESIPEAHEGYVLCAAFEKFSGTENSLQIMNTGAMEYTPIEIQYFESQST